MDQQKNKWKAIAIIFIVLFVLENIFMIYAYKVGTKAIENETECAYNVCENYETYYYDSYEKICYCYNDEEIEKQKYMS